MSNNEPQAPPDRQAGQKSPTWQALGLAWELGYTIAIPLVLFALGGRWADRTFRTSPWLLLSGMGLAIIFTTFFLVRKFSRMMRDVSPPPKQ